VLILGVETATEQVSIALGGHEGVIGLFEVARGRRHAEILTPAIEFVCAQADIGLDELGLVAVDVGPGLFTGMRVGLAAGKALAMALRVPMIGISSLDLLAFPHRRSDRVVVPVIDARKGEVFYAMYRQVPGGVQQVVAPRVGPVDELVADLLARSQEALCVGNGALRYREQIRDGFHCEVADDAHPSAGPLVQLAHARALREEWVSPSEIRPVYLRQPDAQINWSAHATHGPASRRT
jgi:tRNA threonylcarbamoyladenosine biosynthesis protein TsaB